MVAGGGDATINAIASSGSMFSMLPLGIPHFDYFTRPTRRPAREKLQQNLGYGHWPAFIWAALRVLHRYPILAVRASSDCGQSAQRTPFIFIGNNEYAMGFDVGPRTCLGADQLCRVWPSPHPGA